MNDTDVILTDELSEPVAPAEELPPTGVAGELAEDTADNGISELPSESAEPFAGEERLRELARREAIDREYAEFTELFPELSIAALPDEVSASVASGTPLAAACALYRLRREREAAKAAEVNAKNAELSPGEVRNAPSGYLTLEEMKFMSPNEIRRNYPLVIESLKHSK